MSITVPLYGFGGGGSGGGAGAALTVTAPAGVTVTVSKEGKSYTKTANADGLAVFKGLKTGTWTVTISDGSQTASREVEVTADYETAMTFFSATISVTYPAGSACTCSDGVTTLTAPDTSGSAVFTVPNAGTWTVTANGWSEDVPITANAEVADVDLTKIYLFKDGDQYADRTGGWTSDNYYYSSSSYTIAPAEIGETIHTRAVLSSKNFASLAGTVQQVDLTGFNTILVNADTAVGSVQLFIANNYNIHSSTAVSSLKLSAGVNSLDISGLTGSYYVVVGGATSSNSKTAELITEKIWME